MHVYIYIYIYVHIYTHSFMRVCRPSPTVGIWIMRMYLPTLLARAALSLPQLFGTSEWEFLEHRSGLARWEK